MGPNLSVIIPTLNEQDCVPLLLADLNVQKKVNLPCFWKVASRDSMPLTLISNPFLHRPFSVAPRARLPEHLRMIGYQLLLKKQKYKKWVNTHNLPIIIEKSDFVTFYCYVFTHLKFRQVYDIEMIYSMLAKLTYFQLNHNSTFAKHQSKTYLKRTS